MFNGNKGTIIRRAKWDEFFCDFAWDELNYVVKFDNGNNGKVATYNIGKGKVNVKIIYDYVMTENDITLIKEKSCIN